MPGLEQELRTHLGALLDREVDIRDLRRIPGGASHETWSCDLRDGQRLEQLMVRRDIADGLLDSDGAVEFALLGTLHALGVPVPQPWLRTETLTVMERIAGHDARKVLARTDHGVDVASLGLDLVRALAAIHAVDHATLSGVLPPAGQPDEVRHWGELVERHRTGPEPLLSAAISWLHANRPAPVQPVLVHGDFKANNVLVSPDGRVVVIDWEMTHLGDPVEDLAWTLLWDTDYDLVGGMLSRHDLLTEYERLSGTAVDPEALFFWELHALVKLAAIFLTGVRPGAAPLPSLQMLGRATPHIDRQIAQRLERALDRGAA